MAAKPPEEDAYEGPGLRDRWDALTDMLWKARSVPDKMFVFGQMGRKLLRGALGPKEAEAPHATGEPEPRRAVASTGAAPVGRVSVDARSPGAQAAISSARDFLGLPASVAPASIARDLEGTLHVGFEGFSGTLSSEGSRTEVQVASGQAQGATVRMTGPVPEDVTFFDLPFGVPPQTAELQLSHGFVESDRSPAARRSILDVGVFSPSGFRGYGGGNEEPLIIGEHASSRSYLTGALEPGRWRVEVGKAVSFGQPHYDFRIQLRTAPTLEPQPERSPYRPAPPLSNEERWYAGDFHVHSEESGDAGASVEDIVDYAQERGLDFVELSDHNTVSQADFIREVQAENPNFLVIPGTEFTSPDGHANLIGNTRYVSPRQGSGVKPFTEVVEEVKGHPERVLVAINHPAVEVGNFAPSMSWRAKLPPPGPDGESISAVEVASGNEGGLSSIFNGRSLAFYEQLCAQGYHPAVLGGSDDHHGGHESGLMGTHIGSPTTLVRAKGLSVEAIQDAVVANRTVVKTRGPDDPMLELQSAVAPKGDTILADRTTLRVRVTGGKGGVLSMVKNGERVRQAPIPSNDFSFEATVDAPPKGEDRYRFDVLMDGQPRTIASYLWLRRPGPPGGQQGAATGR